MKYCLNCNKEFKDDFVICPYCGKKLLVNYKPECTWIGHNVNSNVENKIAEKKIKNNCNLDDILLKILKLSQYTMCDIKTWNDFGYKGLPTYDSKLSVLFDIRNVSKKVFLISECMASGIGIGINLLVYNKLIKNEQIKKSVNYIMSCISSNRQLYGMLFLDENDKKKCFVNNVYDYVNEYYMDDKEASSGTGFVTDFFASLGPRHKFYKLFLSHMEKSNVYDSKFDKGIRNLVSFYFDNYDKPFKQIVIDFNIIDNL